MNLRIVPAVQTSPTVIFSLNWHNLPSGLPLPNFYSTQFAACQDSNIPVPRSTLALDKAVGFHLLLESVTFDLARQVVLIAWIDKRSQEWAIENIQGLRAALEDVLACVRQSGEEADKEKKAAAAAVALAKAAANAPSTSGQASVTSSPDATSTASSQIAPLSLKRHRTASGIFSSLVASFITPPSSPDPNTQAQLYRSRRSKSTSSIVPVHHKQSVLNPSNKREQFPVNPVPQSRFLRRQARAKLVDVFRYYVASRLTTQMRAAGIVGDDLRDRGILDDLDTEDDESDAGCNPGMSGYSAAGGYVAYTARSMLRSALSEASSDSMSSSSEDSLLLTPKHSSNTSLPSEVSKSRPASPTPKSTSTPGSPRRRSSTPSPQARQIRHLSSVLIGLTQKDKRTQSEEREMLELVKDRSLRRRWSLCEASGTRPYSHLRSSSAPVNWTKPVISSPLKSYEVADEEDDEDVIIVRQSATSPEPTVPFPSDAVSSPVPFPTGTVSPPPLPRRTRSLPTPPAVQVEEDIVPVDDEAEESMDKETVPSSKPKAAEAEDVLPSSTSRPRRSAILAPPTVSGSAQLPASPSNQTIPLPCPSLPARAPLAPIQTSATEESDLIAIRGLPNLPSPKYTEYDENAPKAGQEKRFAMAQSFPEDVDEDEDEDDEEVNVSPPPQYAPTLPSEPQHSFRDVDVKQPHPTHAIDVDQVRGLELETQGPQVAGYWSHASDGIYVV